MIDNVELIVCVFTEEVRTNQLISVHVCLLFSYLPVDYLKELELGCSEVLHVQKLVRGAIVLLAKALRGGRSSSLHYSEDDGVVIMAYMYMRSMIPDGWEY